MKVFKRQKQLGRISRKQALNSTPVKNSEVIEMRLDSGEVLLTYPVALRPWMASLVRYMGGPTENIRTRKLQLDTLGTSVWDLINGNRSVVQIVRHFSKTHRISLKEAEVSVTRFLRDLGQRGLIGIQ